MLVNLTKNSQDVNRQIAAVIGQPWGIFSKKRWQGIGSGRLILTNATGKCEQLLGGRFTQNFANIELRPRGVIIRVRYKSDVYGIVIPFAKLTLFKTNPGEVNIHFDGERITLRNYQGQAINQHFINKLLAEKALYFQENHAH